MKTTHQQDLLAIALVGAVVLIWFQGDYVWVKLGIVFQP
jgi:hypothetical protein